uniref:Copper binding protein CusF n=1 Tax=Candidatus Kentrum sp. DK TaxID=2126562 RepID=A0A450RZX3_9GAMM|nr:MAG: Copper binding protein CusF [Candidatus Kentron sp. DK]VFJ44908.1 MAG: Copper binding protein CusF [Candidatus Kentron sp. DK]
MKRILFTTAISITMALSQGALAGEEHQGTHPPGHGMAHSQHEAHEAMHDSVSGTGTIHRVSRFQRKVNLTHAPIPAIGWPEMRMDMAVAEDVDLKNLVPGDRISFDLSLGEDNVYRIIGIEKMTAREGEESH